MGCLSLGNPSLRIYTIGKFALGLNLHTISACCGRIAEVIFARRWKYAEPYRIIETH
jgi:hypothetical protein